MLQLLGWLRPFLDQVLRLLPVPDYPGPMTSGIGFGGSN